MKEKSCDHIDQFDFVRRTLPNIYHCEECVKTEDSWIHLRTCQTCGVTLCCDSSPNKHATAHYNAHLDHPIITSAEPGEKWAWCYEHKIFKKYN